MSQPERSESGTRNLYKYVPFYSGSKAKPTMMDGDVFRVIIPLNDEVPAAGEIVPTTPQVTEQVTEQVKRLLICLYDKTLSVKEILERMELKHRPTLISYYIKPAIEFGFIEMTQPNSPKSPTQKYRLTEKGIAYKLSLLP